MSIKTPEYQLNYFTDPFYKKTTLVFVSQATTPMFSAQLKSIDESLARHLQKKAHQQKGRSKKL